MCRQTSRPISKAQIKSSPLAFTLLEILIALMILSCVAAGVGWQVARCVAAYRFSAQVEEVFMRLKQAQILALTYKTNIQLEVFKEKGEYKYRFTTDEPFSCAVFDRSTKKLHAIKKITFNGKMHAQLTFTLVPQGNVEPRGVLAFFGKELKEKEQVLWCDVQGGGLVKLLSKKPQALPSGQFPLPEHTERVSKVGQ